MCSHGSSTNIEPTIAGTLTEYPTAKMLWDALVVTYSSGKDKLQTFNLHVKANDIKQNDSTLEEFWITLQGVWGEIDKIDPNPMKCPDDIKTYARIRSEQKLFQFLNALDRKYKSIKGRSFDWNHCLQRKQLMLPSVRKPLTIIFL